MFAHFQNARQTKRPEEMVKHIEFWFPPGANVVDNPLEDAAFMEQTGAKRISTANSLYNEYELKNAATGMTFTFVCRRDITSDYYTFWELKK